MRPRPPRLLAEHIGGELARYGAFCVRVRWTDWSNGARSRAGEIVLLSSPDTRATSEETEDLIVISPISPREIDLPHVLRSIRVWLTYRAITADADQETLRDMRVALERGSHPIETSSEPDQMDEEQSVTQEELDEFAAFTESLRWDYDRVERACLELEAEHPEIDLAALESPTLHADMDCEQEST